MEDLMLNNRISVKSLVIAALPSLAILVISVFFDSLYNNAIETFSKSVEVPSESGLDPVNLWIYPVIVYGIFIACLFWSKKVVLNKIEEGNSTETEVVKTIEKWSGVVDGIGTALPLIGAAVILFTIGLGEKNQNLFLTFAVPFEIKSLFILASAKLFESVFDEFEIQVQSLYDRTNGHSDESILKDVKVEFINLPTEYQLDEMNKTIKEWKDTVENMKDPKFEETLTKLLKITGKS